MILTKLLDNSNLNLLGYKKEDFKEKVAEICNIPISWANIVDKIQFKIKRFKKYFKGWGYNVAGQLKKNKFPLQRELQDLELMEENGGLFAELARRRALVQANLLQIYSEEELYWFKGTHSTWPLKGDNNT
uniref:Uncharacterized protein n=1 Tax=Arundo donax TaxID=35708 RepID=A0A0A8ZMN6_ARUDO